MKLCWLLGMGLLGLLSGCGGSSSSSSNDAGFVQIINGMVDSPILTADIEDDTYSLNFAQGTGLLELAEGNHTVSVIYTEPGGGDETTIISEFELGIFENTIHTLVIHGSFAEPQLFETDKPYLALDVDDSEIFSAQFINLHSEVSTQVYLGDSELDPDNNVPVASLAQGSASDVLELASGDVRLQVLAEGDDQVRYDSGEFTVAENTRRVFLLHDPVGPDEQSIGSLQWNDSGVLSFANDAALAGVRMSNMVADEASVAVQVVDPVSSDVLADSELLFTESSAFNQVDPAFVNIVVQAASDTDTTVSTTLSFNEDTFYTVVVAGSGIEDNVAVRALAFTQRQVATQASLQFINTLAETDIEDFDEVDFYVLPEGDQLDDVNPLSAAVAYLQCDDGTVTAEESYDLVVTTAGTQSILAGPLRITPAAGDSLLVVVTEAFGGGTPYQIVVHSGD